jgi:hypothetical protein
MKIKSAFYISILLVLTSFVFLNSCYYDNEEYLYNSSNCNDTVYSYNGRVKAIMEQRCAISGCHTGASPDGGISLDNYADVKNNAENGEFFCSINWNSGCSQMPKNSSKLDACTIFALQQWKAKGYPEN